MKQSGSHAGSGRTTFVAGGGGGGGGLPRSVQHDIPEGRGRRRQQSEVSLPRGPHIVCMRDHWESAHSDAS